jgi:hypothetical protein
VNSDRERKELRKRRKKMAREIVFNFLAQLGDYFINYVVDSVELIANSLKI